MKRNLFTIFRAFLLSLVAYNLVFALDHSGNITQDEIWVAADNPHIIQELTTVSGNATLTIEAGVEVRFNPDATNPRLIIGSSNSPGRLIARGTDIQQIIFTSNSSNPQPGDWSNISFSVTAEDDSVIENAVIEYGGYPSQGSLHIYRSNPTIRNCTVRYSSDSGIKLYLSTAELSNCSIEDNALYGVDCDNFSGILDGNLFANNGSYPIRIYPGQSPNPVVNIPNTFVSNNPDQVYFWSYISNDYTFINFGIPYLFLSNVTVGGNATLTIDPGVEVNINTGCSLIIGSNSQGRLIARGTDTNKIIFTSNFPNPQPGDWNGIRFGSTATDDSVIENAVIEYGGSSTGSLQIIGSNPSIRNCTVRYSANHGIYLSVSSAVINCSDIQQNQIGIYATSSNPIISQNNISSNINWGIYNASSSMINAQYNWWGDVSGPSGAGAGFGDAVSEYVAYSPWFLAISDCSVCMGDFEPDGDVDGKNLVELDDHYGCTSNCGAYDLTGDGRVDGGDLGAFALFYGRDNCAH